MCLAAIAIHAHPQWPLLVLANRDEFHQRPSAPLHVWPNTHPPLLAGKDLQSAGSWLCVDACGNFALLTNVRNSGLIRGESAPSRGQLVLDALRGKIPTPQQASIYSGFNLLAGQLLDAHGQAQVRLRYYTNQTASLPFGWSLTHGLHALSNGALNEPWPKEQRLKQKLKKVLHVVRSLLSSVSLISSLRLLPNHQFL